MYCVLYAVLCPFRWIGRFLMHSLLIGLGRHQAICTFHAILGTSPIGGKYCVANVDPREYQIKCTVNDAPILYIHSYTRQRLVTNLIIGLVHHLLSLLWYIVFLDFFVVENGVHEDGRRVESVPHDAYITSISYMVEREVDSSTRQRLVFNTRLSRHIQKLEEGGMEVNMFIWCPPGFFFSKGGKISYIYGGTITIDLVQLKSKNILVMEPIEKVRQEICV